VRHTADWASGTVLLAAIFTLLLLWIALVLVVRRTAPARRRVWGVAAAWAAPFAVGPPLMDTTVYSYVAFGLVQRNGHSPYAGGVSRLGRESELIPAANSSTDRGFRRPTNHPR